MQQVGVKFAPRLFNTKESGYTFNSSNYLGVTAITLELFVSCAANSKTLKLRIRLLYGVFLIRHQVSAVCTGHILCKLYRRHAAT
jgi:hypothetical protein